MAVEVLYHAARDSLEDVMADPKNRIFTSKADADARDFLARALKKPSEFEGSTESASGE